jgi:hypothetical protein
VAVTSKKTSDPMVGMIDKVHWDTDPVWLSLIDVDTGDWRSAQLKHVVGRLENYDPAPTGTPEPPPWPFLTSSPPANGVRLADHLIQEPLQELSGLNLADCN